MADETAPKSVPPAPIVAIAGWLVPGAGYLLIGQRTRGITIGISILSLFVIGLLVGGVRVIEVPGYNVDTGKRQIDSATHLWVLEAAPVNELRNKPWSLPQLMTGPVAIGAGAWSVIAAEPDPARQGHPHGWLTHARSNEIGSLYLSVAGLLNLMVIIDAAHRSVHLAERRAAGLTDVAGAVA